MIPYGRQDILQADIDAVVQVLKSDYLTQGPCVPRFEAALAAHVGSGVHAVAVNSATSALHVACLALDLGPGDILWTSPITFVASSNCALYCGATVDFVDIDPATYNLSVDALTEKLARARIAGNLPKILVPVALCGQSCDMAAIRELADEYDFAIIEDGSHAVGGSYRGEMVGCGRYADITVFSFHPVKIITTAEGGMAMSNSAELTARMELFRSHGITRDPALMTRAPEGLWYYQQIELGYNYRMTELQAALGLSQLERLDEYVARRARLARRYDELLSDLPLQTPFQIPDAKSAWHLYVVRLNLEQIDKSHLEVFEALRAAGIGVNLHYIPVHLQPYYRDLGFNPGDFPEAEAYYAEAVSIPLFPTMTEADQDHVVQALREILRQ
ncbi:UDP-4-amino-4,6-dideoxy-N-acetyl-beta-L-altrosamine transaminase [Roseivivax sp. CAU 1753]